MTCPYHSDLASSQESIGLAREELLRVIDSLNRADRAGAEGRLACSQGPRARHSL
jgi:hypothetical protein